MMDLATLRVYCLAKPGAEGGYPFGEGALVIKVMGKMFALITDDLKPDDVPRINLKCDPALAQILRQTYPAVLPGYHMDKKHWNTVVCDGTIPDDELCEMIDNSYDLVAASLAKRVQKQLQDLAGG